MCKIEKGDDRSLEKKIIHQIFHYANKHRKVMQSNLDQTGVYQAQHRLLMIISRNPYSSQRKLAEVMGVSTSTIAVSLKKLGKAGCINKIMDNEDNRLNRIVITEKGNRIVEQSKQIFQTADKMAFEGFTDEEKDMLSEFMERLYVNLAKMEKEGVQY